MPNILIYSTTLCPYCTIAKRLLHKKGFPFKEVAVDRDPVKRSEMVDRSRRRTVPQIFINDHHVGGCDDLYALEQNGTLDQLLVPG